MPARSRVSQSASGSHSAWSPTTWRAATTTATAALESDNNTCRAVFSAVFEWGVIMDKPLPKALFDQQFLYTASGKQLRDDIIQFLRSKLSRDISPRDFAALAHAAVERVVQHAISRR
jgi:hypothetical protein